MIASNRAKAAINRDITNNLHKGLNKDPQAGSTTNKTITKAQELLADSNPHTATLILFQCCPTMVVSGIIPTITTIEVNDERRVQVPVNPCLCSKIIHLKRTQALKVRTIRRNLMHLRTSPRGKASLEYLSLSHYRTQQLLHMASPSEINKKMALAKAGGVETTIQQTILKLLSRSLRSCRFKNPNPRYSSQRRSNLTLNQNSSKLC